MFKPLNMRLVDSSSNLDIRKHPDMDCLPKTEKHGTGRICSLDG